MPYSEFTLKDLKLKFGIKNYVEPIFYDISPIQPSDWLKTTLQKTSKLRARTEKAKSETIVFPILIEIKDKNDDFITIYSGDTLVADAEKGLTGECDFIITKEVKSFDINFPIMQIVEAKKHDIDIGIPQCAAQMYGAKIYNEKNNTPIDYIYGCVTTGNEWRFLKLNETLTIDKRIYYLNEIELLLSVFQNIVDHYKGLIKKS
ncbi:MAG: hypothetical protein CSA05_00060 [Bacteroidia bacterium]|nr:MAG: hypothetical protein CSB01_00935 [Bacteroidia bacterium]PIE86521.1 MAG: hypothetical protein CSA05_00060 [Bacteroidia bacterium]